MRNVSNLKTDLVHLYYKNREHTLRKQEDILKSLREKYQRTQQEVADGLYVSRQTYSSWECGRSEIPMFSYLKLAVFYEIDIEELMQALF